MKPATVCRENDMDTIFLIVTTIQEIISPLTTGAYAMVAAVVTYTHLTPSNAMGHTRSQVRNAQRKHTAQCLKEGIVIANERKRVYESMKQLLNSSEAAVVLESLAIHRNDCDLLEHNVHFAAEANYLAYSVGNKTARSHDQHKHIHRLANLVKHEHGKHLTGNRDYPPPPPPPPPPLAPPSDPVSITCEAFTPCS